MEDVLFMKKFNAVLFILSMLTLLITITCSNPAGSTPSDGGGEGIRSVYAGSRYTLVLKKDGTLWAAGTPHFGQLGLGDTISSLGFTQVTEEISDIKMISAGTHHVMMVKTDGSLWAVGNNCDGQLGLGDAKERRTYTKVDVSGVEAAYSGNEHTLILKTDGSLWAAGDNEYGQLGIGNTDKQYLFTKVDVSGVKAVFPGQHHTLILKNDGTLWAAGSNAYGQLGLGANSGPYTSFTQVDDAGSDVQEVYVGSTTVFSLILKKNGTLWAAGHNMYGQLGLGTSDNVKTFTKITDISDVRGVCTNNDRTMVVKNDGTLWVTGSNSYGVLGLGTEPNQLFFKQVESIGSNVTSVHPGYSHTMVLKNDGTLWAAGDNSSGAMGFGDKLSRNIFTPVPFN